MPLKVDEYNQLCVVVVDGDLSGDNAAMLRKTVEERIAARMIADYVIDMEKCPLADSEGLETLLWLKRRAEEIFGQLKLVALDDNMRKILEITRLEHRFDIQPDLETAVKMMR